nr:amino acid ABC transporter permease [Zhenpiania hominis]
MSGGDKVQEYLQGVIVAAKGAPTTLLISLVAVFIGLILGLLVAMAKMSRFKILRGIATIYVDILRGTPLLVQVLILAYGIPQIISEWFGVSFHWEIKILIGFIACGVNSSAYMAEIIRSGLQAVDIGQTEAARSLGMSSAQTMRYIIIPQAFKIIVPALGNEFIALIKETAILSVAGIVEITRRGQLWASQSFLSFQAYIGVAVIYLIMTLTLSRIVAYLERRMAQGD